MILRYIEEKMHEPIITSMLDTDLYKYTMMQCVLHHYPNTQVQYRFKCRQSIDLRSIAEKIKAQVVHYCSLNLQEDELQYLQSFPFFKTDFINYLRNYRLTANHVKIETNENLDISIQGSWLETILFEVPLLAIISELYYHENFPNATLQQARENLKEKIALLQQSEYQGLRFSDFGTRRRFSKIWQKEILETLKTSLPHQFVGTSNLYLAKNLKLKPIGTMAHEFLQAFQVLAPRLQGSQNFALNVWLEEYQDQLGIALTDVLTMDIFLQEFDRHLAARFKGLRQDSGDPIAWGEKALQHYQSLGISPHDKTFVFSNGLTFPHAIKIYNHFKDKCQQHFGIGTNLTNDVGLSPIDIVIKMTQANQHPVVKISDSPGKIISEDPKFLEHVKSVFKL